MGYFGSYFGGGGTTDPVSPAPRLYLFLYTDVTTPPAVQGDTVWLGVVFKDEDGTPIDPDFGSVKLRTYDANGKALEGPFDVSEAQYRVGVGTFEYPYVLPLKQNPLVFEYAGEASGRVELGRASLATKFV